MRLTDRQFDLVALMALAAFLPHLLRMPLWLGIGLAVIAPLRMLARRRGARLVPVWLRVPAVGILVALIIVEYGNIFGRGAGSSLAAGLLMLKLLETERSRDARAALGFSAFVLMSALLFTQTLLFTAALCLSLVLLLAALNALEPAPVSPAHPLKAGMRTGAILFALGLPLAAAAFLFVPRLSSPLWGAPGLDQQPRTGLDERMSPGSLVELLIDDTPALRVRFDGATPPPAARYFRALVLWDFDGTTWTRDSSIWQRKTESIESRSAPLDYEITLEPTDRPWLVALDVPLSAPDETRLGSDRTLATRLRVATPRQYRARSVIDYRLAADLDGSDRKRALRLPDGFNARTRELATQWRSEGRSVDAIIRSSLEMFNASFSYTLTPPLLGRDSVDDFLFSTRAGYCEHYSSAFVFLMRAAGVPARVVTGYQGGWQNDSANYLLVRQSDAHAWAEVWLDGRGWVRVDPTAAVSPARIEDGASAVNRGDSWLDSAWLLDMRNRLDVVNRVWTQTIVQFNALRQSSLLTPFGKPRISQSDLLLLLASFIALVLLVATVWVLRAGPQAQGDALDAAWRKLQRKLARAGMVTRNTEGPLDALARVFAHVGDAPLRAQIAAIVERYVGLRYAQQQPPAEHVQAFERAVRELRVPRVVAVSGRATN